MPKYLPDSLTEKWKYFPGANIIGATVKVTNENVRDLVWELDGAGFSSHYHIFSGVHGVPFGCLQVDDEDFYLADKAELEDDDRIEVTKMPLQQVPPAELMMALDRSATKVIILAWCYSADYVEFTLKDRLSAKEEK